MSQLAKDYGRVARYIERFLGNMPGGHANRVDALDLLFDEQFGWPPGTAEGMSLAELELTLDHMTNDSPDHK